MKANTKATRDKAANVFNSVYEHLGYLKARWQDERMFESFGDYEVSARKAFDELGAKLISISKAFTCVFAVDDSKYKLTIGAREVKYVRIA